MNCCLPEVEKGSEEQLIELTFELEVGKNLGVLRADPAAMVLDMAAVSGLHS